MQNNWYAAAKSIDLKNKPLASKLLDEPIVLFRDSSGQAVALVDRCPHRNVKLSKGKVINGNVQCPYHGWEFNNQGKCVNIPSLLQDEKIPPSACSSTYPVIEQQDIIWVWVGNRKPNEDEKPFSIPHFDEDGWNHNWVECNKKYCR